VNPDIFVWISPNNPFKPCYIRITEFFTHSFAYEFTLFYFYKWWPAHIKSSLFGCELTIPISNGQLALGMWQGIYLGENRDSPHVRKLVLTVSS